jgi:PAS domain-containing protein
MSWRPPDPVEPREWRRRAEEVLASEDDEDLGGVELRRVVHELRVHQIELELQNEALQEARLEAEAGWERFQELYDFAPFGLFSVDGDATILEVNLSGARLLGADRAHLVHVRFPRFLNRSDQTLFARFLHQGMKGPEAPPCEVTLAGKRVRLQGASADGKVLQMAALDVTDLFAAQELLRQQVAQLTARLEEGRRDPRRHLPTV